MLRSPHFASLRPGSVFINTVGSIQIHEAEFIEELRKGRMAGEVTEASLATMA